MRRKCEKGIKKEKLRRRRRREQNNWGEEIIKILEQAIKN